MRKIEQQMLRAIRERRNWKKSNTRVNIVNKWAEVFLFGNKIAQINLDSGEIWASYCHWPTLTTLSRFKALGIRVRQKDRKWFIERADGDTINTVWCSGVGVRNIHYPSLIAFDKDGRFLRIDGSYPEMLTEAQIRERERQKKIDEMKNSAKARELRTERWYNRTHNWWTNPDFI